MADINTLAAFIADKKNWAGVTKMQSRDDIFALLRDALVELFELEPEQITLEANLYQDLEKIGIFW